MNVEEVMKKLEEIKVELYNNVTSSEDKSPVQVETQDRLPIDEDLAGEEVKIKRTKGEKVKDRGNMSRSSSQDGSKNPDKDYVFGKNAPSVDELQNQLDGLFKNREWFPDSERDWMEDDAANAFNPERHTNEIIKDIVGNDYMEGLLSDISERIARAEEADHVSFRPYSDKELRKKLLPIIAELVRNIIKLDMSKYRYSGP